VEPLAISSGVAEAMHATPVPRSMICTLWLVTRCLTSCGILLRFRCEPQLGRVIVEVFWVFAFSSTERSVGVIDTVRICEVCLLCADWTVCSLRPSDRAPPQVEIRASVA
jgi:hypothetical protein